jgi:hypothetical protein
MSPAPRPGDAVAADAGLSVARTAAGGCRRGGSRPGTPVTWPTEDTHHPEQCDPVLLTGAFRHNGTTFEIVCSVGVDPGWCTS